MAQAVARESVLGQQNKATREANALQFPAVQQWIRMGSDADKPQEVEGV